MQVIPVEQIVGRSTWMDIDAPQDTPQARRAAEVQLKDCDFVKHFGPLYALYPPHPLRSRGYTLL